MQYGQRPFRSLWRPVICRVGPLLVGASYHVQHHLAASGDRFGKVSANSPEREGQDLLQIIEIFIGEVVLVAGVCEHQHAVLDLSFFHEQGGCQAVLSSGQAGDVVLGHSFSRACRIALACG